MVWVCHPLWWFSECCWFYLLSEMGRHLWFWEFPQYGLGIWFGQYLIKWRCVRCSSHWGGSPQDGLRDVQTYWMILASAYVLCCLSAVWLQLQMIGRSLRWEWVLIWCVAIEHWGSSSIRVIFVDYQTSKLQCNY